jgi:hypothetical protein
VLKNSFLNGKFTFKNLGVVTGSAGCTEGYGYDRHDNGVRWNDLDGDGMLPQTSPFISSHSRIRVKQLTLFVGRADFLCMQSDGTIHGYLNKGIGNMVNQGQIKFSIGKERKSIPISHQFSNLQKLIWSILDLRIADIDGDGRADLLVLDMTTGETVACT